MFSHLTVLKNELISDLNIPVGGIAIDCTAGGGGHTGLMLDQVGYNGTVIAIDRDPVAREHLSKKFSSELKSERLIIAPHEFSHIGHLVNELDIFGKVDSIGADLGVSSPQIDTAERGFSFQKNGPLDMRMNPENDKDASFVVNNYTEQELANIFWRFGEEPKSRFIAKAIIKRREKQPIQTTLELADLIKENIRYKTKSKKHPATKSFQALRIYVNNELGELESLCEDGFKALKPHGRMSIITFHSLEDRFVKRYFKDLANPAADQDLKKIPLSEEELSKLSTAQGKIVKPFPGLPSKEEAEENPRARSAKLRSIMKIS